jgi:hypothetical protein
VKKGKKNLIVGNKESIIEQPKHKSGDSTQGGPNVASKEGFNQNRTIGGNEVYAQKKRKIANVLKLTVDAYS